MQGWHSATRPAHVNSYLAQWSLVKRIERGLRWEQARHIEEVVVSPSLYRGPANPAAARPRAPRPHWFDSGNCHGKPVELFLETDGLDEATAICEGCPVRTRCLEYALGLPDVVGVWGGTTAATRRALRSRREFALRQRLRTAS